ncbi:MAG: hypothetical protein ACWGPN_15775, partial [Gammaproteobacteria bacterium]
RESSRGDMPLTGIGSTSARPNGVKRTNDGTMRDGQLDEGLVIFRTEPVDEHSGVVIFQFETGGFNISFRAGMTMTEMADKLEQTAERVRRYKKNGWPMYLANGN